MFRSSISRRLCGMFAMLGMAAVVCQAGSEAEFVRSPETPEIVASPAMLAGLVERLNKSAKDNQAARMALLRVGKPAAAGLVDSIQFRPGKRPKKKQVVSATRVLRVLRLLRSPAGIEACKAILLGDEVEGNGEEEWALLTEAIAYLCEQFPDPRARDAYVTFVHEHQRRYMGKMYMKRHWHGGGNRDVFRVDVSYGIPLLLKADDPRVKDVLKHVLVIVTQPTFGGSFVWHLREDGYSTEQEATTTAGRPRWPQSLTDALNGN